MRRLLIMVLVVGALVSGFPRADSQEAQVQFVQTSNELAVRMPGAEEFLPRPRCLLSRGAAARTNQTGIAQAHLGQAAMIAYIGPATEVEVGELLENAHRRMQLKRGRVRAYRRLRDQPGFQITTPNASLTARGTELLVQYQPAAGGEVGQRDNSPEVERTHDLGAGPGETRVAMLHGDIETHDGGFEAGDTLVIRPGGEIVVKPRNFRFTIKPRRGLARLRVDGQEFNVAYHYEEGVLRGIGGQGQERVRGSDAFLNPNSGVTHPDIPTHGPSPHP